MYFRVLVLGVSVLLLQLAYITMAFLNKPKLHYNISEDTLQEIKDSETSFYSEEIDLFSLYRGTKAISCETNLTLNPLLPAYILHSLMLQATWQIKHRDTKIHNNVKKCDGEQSCIDKAMTEGKSMLEALKTPNIQQIKEISKINLEDTKGFLDSCNAE